MSGPKLGAAREIIAALMAGGMDPAEAAKLLAYAAVEVMHRPKRALHERDFSGPCYVYWLVYPINEKPFYVGISKNPWSRFDNHWHDASSAAYPILRKISSKADRDSILKIYKECADRNEALDLEYSLIMSLPGLVNKSRKHTQMFEYHK